MSEVAAKIDRSKLIVGIGSFGYEWKQGIRKHVSVQYVWDKIALYGGQIRFDARSLNPAFQYYDNNIRNDLWYLDAVTMFNQMRSALSVKPAGVAVWRMGMEDPGVWSFINRNRFPDDEASRRALTSGSWGRCIFDVSGPLLAIAPDQSGKRELIYNQGSGLITSETLVSIPRKTIPFHGIARKIRTSR